jgi:prephenate dehydrogenase
MTPNTYGFIGLGLIGGSIAKAIRTARPDAEIIAFDTNSNSLLLAQKEHIADFIFTKADSDAFSRLGSCEFIFLCAPVSSNDQNLTLIKEHLSEGSLLTDVGSVKNTIHNTIDSLGLSHCFIGGHPMTGSEKIGFEHADEKLLENAYYILTPGKDVADKQVQSLKELILQLRAIPLILEAERHDYITAAISHLPHIIAASLVNLVHDKDADGFMKMIAAGGFKDITRIASSSPVMWQSICMTNTKYILNLLDDYILALEKVRDKLTQKDAALLYEFFDSAKAYRDSFNNIGSGPIKKEFVLYVDLKDETGAIAQTATLLANAKISIKNIGIMHNREVQDGALRIEFYDEPSKMLAQDTLLENHYQIF